MQGCQFSNEFNWKFGIPDSCLSFPTEVLGLVADSVLKLRFSALCGPN